MAADILLYGATYVPVGDDQTQHLEFARDISTRLNTQFGELFVVPKAVKEQHQFFGKDQGLRIKDLADPAKKMSKSDETGKGVIFLTDTPDVARKKVMSATTDSLGQINYDYDKQPGVSSLIDLMALLKGVDKQEVIDQYGGQTMYGPFKTEVADIVANFLTDFQTKLAAVDDKVLLAKLESDEKLMNEKANATLLKVQKAVGLR
jgi:tryptophanyl-tRNA synthetase